MKKILNIFMAIALCMSFSPSAFAKSTEAILEIKGTVRPAGCHMAISEVKGGDARKKITLTFEDAFVGRGYKRANPKQIYLTVRCSAPGMQFMIKSEDMGPRGLNQGIKSEEFVLSSIENPKKAVGKFHLQTTNAVLDSKNYINVQNLAHNQSIHPLSENDAKNNNINLSDTTTIAIGIVPIIDNTSLATAISYEGKVTFVLSY